MASTSRPPVATLLPSNKQNSQDWHACQKCTTPLVMHPTGKEGSGSLRVTFPGNFHCKAVHANNLTTKSISYTQKMFTPWALTSIMYTHRKTPTREESFLAKCLSLTFPAYFQCKAVHANNLTTNLLHKTFPLTHLYYIHTGD